MFLKDCGLWHSVHIDDLHPPPEEIPSVSEMHGKSVSALLATTKEQPLEVKMDVMEGDQMERMETNEEEPALGNVKDPPTDSSRAIERLKIILNSLQNDSGDMTVLTGIAKHLTSILKEKEQGSTTMMTNWLSAEASKPENINRAGTFRRFAVQCLESKVIPLLAGIIAFIDTNRNLDILTLNEQWKTGLWLQIFNDPELTQLRYTGIVSPSRQQELQEVIVKTTSLEGKVFSAGLPFSWLIFQQIDEVLRNTMNTKEVGDSWFDVVMKATEIFQELPLGRLLSSTEGTYIHPLLKSYILDFVHMVHAVQSEEECNLVCETVRIGCKILIEGEFGRLLPSLLGCHMAHILHDVRLKNFSHIVHVWSGVSRRTVEFQQKESNFHLVTDEEITLDILALHMLIDHLEPSKESLNKPETRTKWLRQVCDYRPIIERIFGHFNQDTDRREFHYGKKCQRGIEQARLQWTRVVVVKLFIEHVCTSGKEELDIRRCMPLWQTFREGADMKDIKSLEKMERFLKLCHKDIVKKCFGDQAKCISCENPIEGAPVRLPCDHVICRKCFYDCVTLKEFECPSCHENFPADLNPNKSENVGEIRKYQDYRTRCNSFFMEVVSQLCFAEGTPPSQEVIEKLLSYIIGHSKGKKIERVVSRELTIFDDSIDPTPVVRSFLLQQLMQTSGHEIETHLLAYFNYADRLIPDTLVGTTGDKQQLIELCLLVMTCMEDSLHQQYANREDEITMATKMLRDAVPNIIGDIELLDKIDNLSKVRFSLTIVSKYIHKLYGTAQKSMPDPTVRKLFDAASKLCEECGSPWPRRYFVKQLCRCYGIESYQTVVEECHDRYIVTGDEYKELRETIVTTVLGGNSEKLELLLQKSFFPTMPQDEVSEIKEALLAARQQTPGENPVFYRCPNGHPYVIGNCSVEAATVGICKACGREIGGEGYKLRAGNEVDTGLDRTETGHILGRATKMGPVSAPERKLNRASFSVLRLLTHISMYVGANVNLQAVCQSIKPNIEQADVGRYLIEHIDLDLTSVQNVLGKNKDEILVLLHYLLGRIMNEHTIAIIGENQTPNVCGLLDKASRSKWEEDFAKDTLNLLFRVINGKILNDQRLGADPLLQILYETDKPQDTEAVMLLQEVPSVWRYRAMITVNHLRQHLDAAKMKLPVLRLFLKEEYHLRAIRFVPSIIRLQKMLMQKYNRKLDRAEATTLTIADVKVQMRQERRLKEFGHLLEDYIMKDITEDTSISHLIPTYKDAGLCSYALLFFLLKKQNIFLDNYCTQTKQKEDNLPKVHVKDISSAHLISYHPDKDLLPMVLANCNYSFEVGQGTRIDYNVTNLERQLMDRFLFSKSLITKIQEIETITYRSESTNAVVFKSLYLRVKQERLNPAVLSQICGELRLKSYPDLCESLDKLDIAISFLKSVGSDPESSLNDFMTNTLKMDNPFPSQKAQQATRCKHTMSLWITLAMERAKFLAKYDKKAFEGISENFKKPLTEDQTQSVEDILNKLPIELIDVFVELLFECIVLKIDVPQNIDDEDYVDMSKICLRDALIGYLDACPYEEDLTIEDTLMTAIGQLPSDKEDPNRILTAQSIEVWSLVNKVFTSKQRQRR
ncbi:RNF213 [Mytilus edulis]|uniref:RNF213 n=1 Tax=Mytilus edulis TaxID=6550 RepID=A0A8S3S1P0_MYTED|nr:RNF213 [Mytilus edulis]